VPHEQLGAANEDGETARGVCEGLQDAEEDVPDTLAAIAEADRAAAAKPQKREKGKKMEEEDDD